MNSLTRYINLSSDSRSISVNRLIIMTPFRIIFDKINQHFDFNSNFPGGLLVNAYRFIDIRSSTSLTSPPNSSNNDVIYYLFNYTKLISKQEINNLEAYEFYEKILSYLLAAWLIIYSIGQFTFYLLSRDDVTYYFSNIRCNATKNKNSLCYQVKFRLILGQYFLNRLLRTIVHLIENHNFIFRLCEYNFSFI